MSTVFADVRFLQAGGCALTDSEVMTLITHGHVPSHQLEKAVGNPERGVSIRRKFLTRTAKLNDALIHLPYQHYDYSKVSNIIVAVG
jgi:hydroxymethylglutaryl-CoA reductase (NADPH)